nr:MAG TPA: hypothetical protein [Caudoviricetes sp.]DAY83600.1 MAG TPA: hypothetical protein [Caudoviricetes sp.]
MTAATVHSLLLFSFVLLFYQSVIRPRSDV